MIISWFCYFSKMCPTPKHPFLGFLLRYIGYNPPLWVPQNNFQMFGQYPTDMSEDVIKCLFLPDLLWRVWQMSALTWPAVKVWQMSALTWPAVKGVTNVCSYLTCCEGVTNVCSYLTCCEGVANVCSYMTCCEGVANVCSYLTCCEGVTNVCSYLTCCEECDSIGRWWRPILHVIRQFFLLMHVSSPEQI